MIRWKITYWNDVELVVYARNIEKALKQGLKQGYTEGIRFKDYLDCIVKIEKVD